MEQPEPIKTSINTLTTARQLVQSIPQNWRNAEIMVSNSVGGLSRIKRVSLHRNGLGRKVVVIHEHDFGQ